MDLKNLLPRGIRPEPKIEAAKRTIPKAAWEQPEMITCKACQRRATRANWNRSLQVCPNCGYHAPIGGYYRLCFAFYSKKCAAAPLKRWGPMCLPYARAGCGARCVRCGLFYLLAFT